MNVIAFRDHVETSVELLLKPLENIDSPDFIINQKTGSYEVEQSNGGSSLN